MDTNNFPSPGPRTSGCMPSGTSTGTSHVPHKAASTHRLLVVRLHGMSFFYVGGIHAGPTCCPVSNLLLGRDDGNLGSSRLWCPMPRSLTTEVRTFLVVPCGYGKSPKGMAQSATTYSAQHLFPGGCVLAYYQTRYRHHTDGEG